MKPEPKPDHSCGPRGHHEPDLAAEERARNEPYPDDFTRQSQNLKHYKERAR